jgi:hypothetical protein
MGLPYQPIPTHQSLLVTPDRQYCYTAAEFEMSG